MSSNDRISSSFQSSDVNAIEEIAEVDDDDSGSDYPDDGMISVQSEGSPFEVSVKDLEEVERQHRRARFNRAPLPSRSTKKETDRHFVMPKVDKSLPLLTPASQNLPRIRIRPPPQSHPLESFD